MKLWYNLISSFSPNICPINNFEHDLSHRTRQCFYVVCVVCEGGDLIADKLHRPIKVLNIGWQYCSSSKYRLAILYYTRAECFIKTNISALVSSAFCLFVCFVVSA